MCHESSADPSTSSTRIYRYSMDSKDPAGLPATWVLPFGISCYFYYLSSYLSTYFTHFLHLPFVSLRWLWSPLIFAFFKRQRFDMFTTTSPLLLQPYLIFPQSLLLFFCISFNLPCSPTTLPQDQKNILVQMCLVCAKVWLPGDPEALGALCVRPIEANVP